MRYPNHQQLNKRRREKVTSWNLNKRHSVDNINDSLKEWGVIENSLREGELIRAVENLDCPKLYCLLKPQKTMLEQRMILRLTASLVHYNFSARAMTRTLEHTRLSANLAFRILIQHIPTTKYSSLSNYFTDNIWYDQDDDNITTIWPIEFLSILINRGNLLKGESFLKALYINCVNNTYLNPINPLTGSAIFQVTPRKYKDIKKITLNFFQEDENFGRKIFPGLDVIVREQLCCCQSHVNLSFSVVKIINDQLSLSQLCRKVIRQNIRRNDIMATLEGLQLPKQLLVHLMYLNTPESVKNDIEFELKFLSSNVSSWENYRLVNMFTSPSSKAALPDDAPILKLKPNISGRNCIYK
jgi:hypothetical protein